MSEEFVDVVDEEDNVVGKARWKDMVEKALLHRSANTIVFNSKGEIFIHKRGRKLKIYPGMYDIKVGGSVMAGESYESAAKRELFEELAIKGVELEPFFYLKFRSDTNNANRMVFKCVYDGEIKIDKDEVESGEFMKIEECERLMKEGKLSPSAKQVFEEFLEKSGKIE